MSHSIRSICVLLLVVTVWQLPSNSAIAQVQPATATAPVTTGVTFRHRPAAQGDVAVQNFDVSLHMEMTMVLPPLPGQTSQPEEQTTDLHRQQQRVIRVIAVQNGLVTEADIEFPVAMQSISEGGGEPQKQNEPVAGKKYRVKRLGEQLEVRDAEGNIPSMEEFALVVQSAESIGRVNPLAKALNGRTLKIGETLRLPREAAQSLFAVDNNMGDISDFSLTLRAVGNLNGIQTAECTVMLKAASRSGTQVGMETTGRLWIASDSCRMIAAELDGAIGIAEQPRPSNGNRRVTGRGKLHVVVRLEYPNLK